MTQRHKTKTKTHLNLYAIGQVAAIVFFLFLLSATSPGLQSLSNLPSITPQELDVSMGQHNQQHAIWADRIPREDGAIRVAIKYARYDESVWSEPIALSNAVIPSVPLIPPGYWGPLNWQVVTSLACSRNGSMSAGWITYDSYFSNDLGSVHYVKHDGNTWTSPSSLTNHSNIFYFQLQYDLDGVLYAAWLEFNYSSYSEVKWQLYCWQVGAPSGPQLVFTGNETFYHYSYSAPLTLLLGRNGSIYLFCKPRSSILFRYCINDSWSAVDSFYDDYYNVWDAEIDSQDRVHLVYGRYDGVYTDGLQYTSFFNDTWDVSTTLVQYVTVDRVWLAVSYIDEVRLLWTQPSLDATYYPDYFTLRYFNGSWASKMQVMGLPSGQHETQLVLGAGDTYLFQEQPLGSARQFAHYQLGLPHFSATLGFNITEIHLLAVVATSIPQMLAQLQIYTLGVGTLMIVGVVVFLPFFYRFLQSSFGRIFQH